MLRSIDEMIALLENTRQRYMSAGMTREAAGAIKLDSNLMTSGEALAAYDLKVAQRAEAREMAARLNCPDPWRRAGHTRDRCLAGLRGQPAPWVCGGLPIPPQSGHCSRPKVWADSGCEVALTSPQD